MALPPGVSSFRKVGLWRSWERASMAWKRSSVRSRPGPPLNQQLTRTSFLRLVAFGSKFSKSLAGLHGFRLLSEFCVNRVDRCLNALRDLLHVHVRGRCGTRMPKQSLDVLDLSLIHISEPT